MIQDFANSPNHVDVSPFIAPPDIIFLAGASARQYCKKRASMILDKEPIAYVASIAVDRQCLAMQRVQYDERDKLLWKMIRTIIIRTIRDDDRKPIGPVPGTREMVGGGLRC